MIKNIVNSGIDGIIAGAFGYITMEGLKACTETSGVPSLSWTQPVIFGTSLGLATAAGSLVNRVSQNENSERGVALTLTLFVALIFLDIKASSSEG